MIALPYILFVLILFGLYIYGNYKPLFEKESIIATCFFFIVFFGFRGYIFNDVFNYKSFFDTVPNIITVIKTHYTLSAWWEPGFVYYCSLFKTFTHSFFIFQIFDTMIDFILLYKSLQWFDSNDCLSYMIFFAMSGLVMFIETFRNVKSILLFFISLRYICNHNFLKYLCCCFLALSFHISSIIFFPLYFILSKNYSRLILIVLFLFSIIFFFFSSRIFYFLFSLFSDYMPDRLSNMVNSYIFTKGDYSIQRGLSLGLIEKVLTYFLIFILYEDLYKGKMILIINCFLLYFSFYFIFSGFIEISYRLSLLFVFSYWVLWPRVITSLHTKRMQILFLICFLFYAILKMSQYSQPIQEYDNIIFGGAKNYLQRNNTLRHFYNTL
jgi:hypothetical protein